MINPTEDARALEAALRLDRSALDAVLAQSSSALAAGWRLDRDAADSLRLAEQHALRAESPDGVVHAAALRALHLARDRSRLEEAIDVARRASRMARTEAQPEMEYLAHLILARIRRLSGRPYLATRILTALSRYCSPSWQPWIGWELCMAGGLSATDLAGGGPAPMLLRALGHARDGDRVGWHDCLEALRPEAWPLVTDDVARVEAAIDPRADTADPLMSRWRGGEIDATPDGLVGLASGAGVGFIACIVVDPASPPRRILRIGARLAEAHDTVDLAPTQRRGARVDTMLALLALCPSGMEMPDSFRAAWGFRFVETIHGEALAVTLHRARERLGEHGRIDRAKGVLRLIAHKRLVVPDLRRAPDADERLLQHVARHGCVNARDAARALRMSLRAVQNALKDLVDGGACARRRDGRSIVYAVEDTTFREPTAF